MLPRRIDDAKRSNRKEHNHSRPTWSSHLRFQDAMKVVMPLMAVSTGSNLLSTPNPLNVRLPVAHSKALALGYNVQRTDVLSFPLGSCVGKHTQCSKVMIDMEIFAERH